ncbi:MAG: CcmD family protein [Calditrichales bacterium]|nr:MAG: CcmD family protein [Calditrichales bacterium]
MEPIYIVLVIILVIWAGIFGYMLHLDKEVKNLREKLKNIENKNEKAT